MEITFVNPGVDYMIQGILSFQEEAYLNSGLLLYTISIRSLIGRSPQVCRLPKEKTTLRAP